MNAETIDVERAVIGGLMVDQNAYSKVSGMLLECDFSAGLNQAIYRVIASQVEEGKPADPVTVGEVFGDISSVARIAASVVSTVNIEHYAGIVREKSQKRRFKTILQETLENGGQSGLNESIADIQTKLEALVQRTTGVGKNFTEVIKAGIDTIERASIAMSTDGIVGVPTGFQSVDGRVGGLQAPRLIVVAARPSIGKTALVNQVALHAAEHEHGVGICSLEMGEDELAIRALANRYQVNGSALAFGHEEEISAVSQKMADKPIHHYPLWIDADTFGLGGVIARITEWKRKHDIKLAVVDHIGLIEVDGATSANDRLGKISRALKKLAKRLNIPVIAVSQLNRSVEKEKRWPTLADLRDSGSIEQDADICMFLHADAQVETETNIPMHIGLLKNRVGRKGWLRERFIFNGRTQTFFEDGQWPEF